MATKLYVGNLSYQTDDSELKSFFADLGGVETARVITDRDSGRSKGFGFVEMTNDDEATKAIEALNGRDFGGRTIRVDRAQEKEGRG